MFRRLVFGVWSLITTRDKFGCVCDGCFAVLSMMTTPEPLSAFVITMSLRHFSSLTAFTSDLGGCGPLLSM